MHYLKLLIFQSTQILGCFHKFIWSIFKHYQVNQNRKVIRIQWHQGHFTVTDLQALLIKGKYYWDSSTKISWKLTLNRAWEPDCAEVTNMFIIWNIAQVLQEFSLLWEIKARVHQTFHLSANWSCVLLSIHLFIH